MNERFYQTNLLYYVIPEPVRKALAIFGAHGYRAYVVGGAVRDIIRGAEIHDWDITTETLPEVTKHLFSVYPTYDTGIKHGTVTVNIDGMMIEITTFRTDGEYLDSRHPKEVIFTDSLYEDLRRRDFTVNAMALNFYKDLEDPFFGMQDLTDRVIRAVGDPECRFTEDALRIMRAFRFSATLCFDIEEETLKAAAKCAYRLANISRERINEEWRKLLTARLCSKTLLTMHENGIFKIIFPGLEFKAFDLERLDSLEPIYSLRSAAFFKNVSPTGLSEAASRINFTKNELSEVVGIISAYNSITKDPSQNLRRFCYYNYKNAEYAVTLADHEYLIPADLLCEVKAVLSDKSMIWSRKELALNGRDILSAYAVPKENLSKITDELVLRVVDGKVPNEKSALLEEIAKII